VAWLPVGSAMALSSFLLAVTANRYGYHRDELYFRMLDPAWGYVDQPPLTPLLARLAIAAFGDTVWALRVPALACAAAAVLITALTTRELGGGRTAQALSAFGFAFAPLTLVAGHVLLTASLDLVVWAAVILFAARALLRAEPRWWLAAGAVVGIGLYNKQLVVLLLISLAGGLLAVGPRRVLRSPWLWAGVALAVVLASPNLVYQATHDWPQLTMAGMISDDRGGENRLLLLPFQLLLLGPGLVWICVEGFRAIMGPGRGEEATSRNWRPLRAVAIAYPVALAITFIAGGQIYYPLGLLAFLFAAGCVPTGEAMARATGRRGGAATAVALNTAFSVVIALPLLPVDVLGRTPIPEINQAARDSVGWPQYVETVADVYRGLSTEEQSRAVLYTSNYGEAGALHRYGPDYVLPPVYSGHNQLWFAGPPPGSATVVVAWTQNLPGLSRFFAVCDRMAVMDNGFGVDNEEQGSVVAVCRDPQGGWPVVWPQLQHYS
jgi:hypothetical protein